MKICSLLVLLSLGLSSTCLAGRNGSMFVHIDFAPRSTTVTIPRREPLPQAYLSNFLLMTTYISLRFNPMEIPRVTPHDQAQVTTSAPANFSRHPRAALAPAFENQLWPVATLEKLSHPYLRKKRELKDNKEIIIETPPFTHGPDLSHISLTGLIEASRWKYVSTQDGSELDEWIQVDEGDDFFGKKVGETAKIGNKSRTNNNTETEYTVVVDHLETAKLLFLNVIEKNILRDSEFSIPPLMDKERKESRALWKRSQITQIPGLKEDLDESVEQFLLYAASEQKNAQTASERNPGAAEKYREKYEADISFEFDRILQRAHSYATARVRKNPNSRSRKVSHREDRQGRIVQESLNQH